MTVPNLLVQLDDTSGAFVHNVTAYVHLPSGVEIKRGRNDEDDTVGPSELKLRLDNVDGRFTLGSATYGIRIDQRIRVIETVGATTSTRFTGYVEDWPTSWPSPSASHAVTHVTAVDRLARLERRKLAGTFVDAEVMVDKPLGRWPLRDEEGSTAGVDVSGNAQQTLTPRGSGASPVFTGTGVTFMAGRKYLYADVAGATTLAGVEVVFTCSTVPDVDRVVMGFNGGFVQLVVQAFEGTPALYFGGQQVAEPGPAYWANFNVCDGKPHHAVITVVSGIAYLYIDGVYLGFAGHEDITFTSASVTVGWGGDVYYDQFVGTVSDFAVYTTAPSAERIAAHAEVHLTDISSDTSSERVARLAAYAGLGATDLQLQTAVLTSVPATQQIDGASVLQAMRDVVDAEGGVLFIRGLGQLTMHNRNHRANKSTQAPELVLTSADVADPVVSGDKQYLENYITGSREGGPTQVVRNQASIDLYDEYPNDISRALYTTDEQVADLISWRVAQYGEPQPRLSSVTLDLLTLPADVQQAALGLELGDRITVSELPAQSPIETADLIVEGWTETVTDQSWDMVLNTVPAERARAWLLGNATYGVLDSTTRLYY
jgi:hypothetical protein